MSTLEEKEEKLVKLVKVEKLIEIGIGNWLVNVEDGNIFHVHGSPDGDGLTLDGPCPLMNSKFLRELADDGKVKILGGFWDDGVKNYTVVFFDTEQVTEVACFDEVRV